MWDEHKGTEAGSWVDLKWNKNVPEVDLHTRRHQIFSCRLFKINFQSVNFTARIFYGTCCFTWTLKTLSAFLKKTSKIRANVRRFTIICNLLKSLKSIRKTNKAHCLTHFTSSPIQKQFAPFSIHSSKQLKFHLLLQILTKFCGTFKYFCFAVAFKNS